MPKISIDNEEYDIENLNADAKLLIDKINMVSNLLAEAKNMQALLTKAKHAYIAELKTEMISAKAGIDFLND